MSLRPGFYGLNYAEWLHVDTVAASGEEQRRALEHLGTRVNSQIAAGAARVAASHSTAFAAVQEDFRKTSHALATTISNAEAGITSAIQQAADYLGAELSGIRWMMERHLTVSRSILDALRQSLQLESRQLFDQGTRCFETGELDMARERFRRALDSNATNHFAHQYLGFIHAAQQRADAAVRSFELAAKFAPRGRLRALALAHRAAAHASSGEYSDALSVVSDACKEDPGIPRLWMDRARYAAGCNDEREQRIGLSNALWLEPTFLPVAVSDNAFEGNREWTLVMLRDTVCRIRQTHTKLCRWARSVNEAHKLGAALEATLSAESVRLQRHSVSVPPEVFLQCWSADLTEKEREPELTAVVRLRQLLKPTTLGDLRSELWIASFQCEAIEASIQEHQAHLAEEIRSNEWRVQYHRQNLERRALAIYMLKKRWKKHGMKLSRHREYHRSGLADYEVRLEKAIASRRRWEESSEGRRTADLTLRLRTLAKNALVANLSPAPFSDEDEGFLSHIVSYVPQAEAAANPEGHAGPFGLVLISAGPKEKHVIHALWTQMKIEYDQSKAVVHAAPSLIGSFVTKMEATDLKRRIETVGGVCRLI